MKLLQSRWTQIGGLLLIGGALAWSIKLAVIVSTDGRIITTGAAALFMKLGLIMFLMGSTGIGNYLSLNRSLFIRVIAILLSPVLVFSSFLLIGTFAGPMFEGSSVWYAQQEGPIVFVVILYAIVGFYLYKRSRLTLQ